MGMMQTLFGTTPPAPAIVTDDDVRDYLARKSELVRTVPAPIAFHPEVRYTGIGSNQPSADLLLREALGWFDIGVRAVANRMASLELEVCAPAMKDGVETLKVLPRHPLSRTLARFGPMHTRRMVLRLVGQYLPTIGENYLLKVRGRGLQIPVELWLLHPARTRPVLSGGQSVGYIATSGSGKEVPLKAEDVVRTWLPDPETLYTAEGYLGPQAIVSDASKFASETVRSRFETNATPPVVIELSAEASMPEVAARERFDEEWLQSYNQRYGAKRGLPKMLPPGFVAKVLEGKFGDEVIPFLLHYRDQLLAALGVPKSILGLTDDAGLGRATAEVNQYVMDLHTVTPLIDMFCDSLTEQLARPDFGDELVVRAKPFVSSDKDFELRREAQDLAGKVRSINEVRRERGAKDASWGELPVGTMADEPYTGDIPTPLDTTPEDPNALRAEDGSGAGNGGALREAVGDTRASPRASSPAELEWQRFLNRERAFVPRFRDQFRAVLHIQERAALKAVDDLGLERGAREVTVAQIVSAVRTALEVKRWTKLFELRTERVRKAAMQSSGMDALKTVGAKAAFIFTDRVKAAIAKQEAEFRDQVTRTTVQRATKRITAAMQESVDAGESLGERTKRIKAAIGDGFEVRRNEAKTIARTEMLKATQKAQVEGYAQSGVVERKQWNTSRDDAVRDSHEIDGQMVALDEDFTLRDGAQGSEPGASSLPVEDVANCRCFLTPVIEE